MEPALVTLIAAAIAFVGTHIVMSHPLRSGMVRGLGQTGFMGVYSLVSLATFVWLVVAFRAVDPYGAKLWDGSNDVFWGLASLLTLVALVLFLGSLKGNPALPDPNAAKGLATLEPAGVFRVTRHPMMWGFALWAIAHILVAPTGRTLVLAGAILVLALLGAHLQDRKKEALMGADWTAWESKTSYWPHFAALPGAGAALWSAALVVWLVITWAHAWIGYVPAGVWRWVG